MSAYEVDRWTGDLTVLGETCGVPAEAGAVGIAVR